MKADSTVDHYIVVRDSIPHFIKYMGSKSSLIRNLADKINSIYDGEIICDLFAGSATLSGAFGSSGKIISNDIQEYSGVLAEAYLSNYQEVDIISLLNDISNQANEKVDKFKKAYPDLEFDYERVNILEDFQKLEKGQQKLIEENFPEFSHHLFVKYYSGTYWSFNQCLSIDILREIAEAYKSEQIYFAILSSLMYAMAYNAQSTGHYAQYRDANTETAMNDIAIYRKKEIFPYFEKKLKEIVLWGDSKRNNHTVLSLDYKDCLESIPEKSIVYADPPYAFVHYSRFYHALETLVKYDYPEVAYKGRYRVDRHQSPFCKRTEVISAFEELFALVARKKCKLILSYSNTGMISLDSLTKLASEVFGLHYQITHEKVDYKHSTMGRKDDKSREVKEFLLIANPQ